MRVSGWFDHGPVVDGEPGVECRLDFAQLGLLRDAEIGRGRRANALIFKAVVSRHVFVWLTFSQTLTAVIAGCEAAWAFFGGVFRVHISDNLKAVVTAADGVKPSAVAGLAKEWAPVHAQRDRPATDRLRR